MSFRAATVIRYLTFSAPKISGLSVAAGLKEDEFQMITGLKAYKEYKTSPTINRIYIVIPSAVEFRAADRRRHNTAH